VTRDSFAQAVRHFQIHKLGWQIFAQTPQSDDTRATFATSRHVIFDGAPACERRPQHHAPRTSRDHQAIAVYSLGYLWGLSRLCWRLTQAPLQRAFSRMRVLVITGAGVSAESGIPTFRGKDGYWRKLDPIKLATPEAFARDPELVWQWYRERRQRIRDAQPNAAHEAIAKLAQYADEFLLVTQNVDDLHERAGLAKAEMVQIHGDIFTTRC